MSSAKNNVAVLLLLLALSFCISRFLYLGIHRFGLVDEEMPEGQYQRKSGGFQWNPYLHRVNQSYLWTGVLGGMGNQKECIQNGILVAHALDMCFIIPRIRPIWWGFQEAGEKGRTDYLPPWDIREQFGNFSLMFDLHHFRESLANIGICTALISEIPDYVEGPWTMTFARNHTNMLRWLKSNSDKGLTHLDVSGTQLTMHNGSPWKSVPTFLRRKFIEKWGDSKNVPRQYTVKPKGYAIGETRGGTAAGVALAGGNEGLFKAVAASMKLIDPVMDIAQQVVHLARKKFPNINIWNSVHTSGWHCKGKGSQHPGDLGLRDFEQLLEGMAKKLIGEEEAKKQGLYVSSQVHPPEFETIALKYFGAVVYKEDVLQNITKFYPFEVCGQVDFEAAFALTEKGIYVGEEISSSDWPIYARKRDAGLFRKTWIPTWYYLCKKRSPDLNITFSHPKFASHIDQQEVI